MKNFLFFIPFFFSVFTKDSFIERSGSYISKIVKEFKYGYYSDQIIKRRDEIKMRLDFIKALFENFINDKELEIILNYYEKYINEDRYVNFLLNDENFLKIIKKLDSVITEKDFSLFFTENK